MRLDETINFTLKIVDYNTFHIQLINFTDYFQLDDKLILIR